MVGSGPNLEESIGSQRQDHFVNLERRRDREVSVHTTHTSISPYFRNGCGLDRCFPSAFGVDAQFSQ